MSTGSPLARVRLAGVRLAGVRLAGVRLAGVRLAGVRLAGVLPAGVLLAGALMVAGCSSGSGGGATPVTGTGPESNSASSSASGSGVSGSGVSGSVAAAPGLTAGKTLATNLNVPWGVTFLGDGSALVAQRPTGQVVKIGKDGGVTSAGTVPGVADQGEGGLLGLAFLSGSTGGTIGTLYAYFTSTSGDNVVARMSYDGTRLATPVTVLSGIASAGNHNGGLLKIGPDDKLWIGTGDAGNGTRSQNRASLNGKILRLNLDGSVPGDNPFPGSPVYSLGHRNVQGLAFDSENHPWAVEFGQNTWDELNRIEAGKNYGWPTVEGKAGRAGFVDPVVQWKTSEASPSGMAIVDDVAYIGGLRGERLWQVPLNVTAGTAGTPKAWFSGEYGRIRSVTKTPGGQLWITTSNRDGRGSPGPDDDRVIPVSLGD